MLLPVATTAHVNAHDGGLKPESLARELLRFVSFTLHSLSTGERCAQGFLRGCLNHTIYYEGMKTTRTFPNHTSRSSQLDDTNHPAKGDTREARMYSRNLMNISTRIRVVNSTLENSVAVRKLRVPHPSRVLCGRVGTRKACAKRIKFFRAEKPIEKSLFLRNFLNQRFTAGPDLEIFRISGLRRVRIEKSLSSTT